MKNFLNSLISRIMTAHAIGWVLISFIYIHVSHSVEIKRLSVPRWIRNGTENSVVLDCEYVYNENDLRLVVKWFFDDNLEPAYQWIPELNRRYTSGVLRDRLDLDFVVNKADSYSRFRALRIKQPSTELSGKYTCLVTSLAGQDAREQVMTVYVPENKFKLSYSELDDSTINVTCEAQGLFPPPVLKLYLEASGGNTSKLLTNSSIHVKNLSGLYDAFLQRTFSIREIASNGPPIFHCSLELPGTDYIRTKRIVSYSGVHGLHIGAAQSVSSASDDKTAACISMTSFLSVLYTFFFSVLIVLR